MLLSTRDLRYASDLLHEMLSVSKWTLCFVSVFVHWFIVTYPTNAHDAAELAPENSHTPDKLNLSRRWPSTGSDAGKHEWKPETTLGRRGILVVGTSESDTAQELPQQHLAVRTPGSGANFLLPPGLLRDPSNLLTRGGPEGRQTVSFAPGSEETQRFMSENPEMAQRILDKIKNGAGNGEEIIRDANGNPIGRVRYSIQTAPGKPEVLRFEESTSPRFRTEGQSLESFRTTGQPFRTETFRQEGTGTPFRREESFRTEGKPFFSESFRREEESGGDKDRDRDRDRSDSDSNLESGSDDDEDKDGGFSLESSSSSSKSPPSGGKSSSSSWSTKSSKIKGWTPAPKDRLLAVVHKRVVKYNQGSKAASNAQWNAAKAAKRKRAAKSRSYSRSGSGSWSTSRSGGSRSVSRSSGSRSVSRSSGSRSSSRKDGSPTKSKSRSATPSRSPSRRSPSPGGKRSRKK